jgi:hypothetical protein
LISTLTDDESQPYRFAEVELTFPGIVRGEAVRKVFVICDSNAPSYAARIAGKPDDGILRTAQCLIPDDARAHALVKRELSRLDRQERTPAGPPPQSSNRRPDKPGSGDEEGISTMDTCTVTWATFVCQQDAAGNLTNCYITELEFLCDTGPGNPQLEPDTGWSGSQPFDPCSGDTTYSPYCWTDTPPVWEDPDPCNGANPPAFCDFGCTSSELLEPEEAKALVNTAWQHSYPGPTSDQSARREVWWLVYFDGQSYSYVEPQYIEQSACHVRPRIYESQLTSDLLFMIHTHPMKAGEIVSTGSGCPTKFHNHAYRPGISPYDASSVLTIAGAMGVDIPLVVIDADSVFIGTPQDSQLHTSRSPRCSDS